MNKNKMPINLFVFAALAAFLLSGCGGKTLVSEKVSVEPNKSEVVELEDGDTYDLVASYLDKEIAGKSYRMLAYNGSIPGPLLKVPQGGEVTINFKNNTEIATSIHSHGIRLDNKYDGVVDDMRPAVQPGGEFVYKIKFPDAGMYWYHPHLYESFAQAMGLYGNYWVVPTSKDYWSPVNDEIPLIISDLLIKNGQLDSFRGNPSSYSLMGKYGNVMLVNGETNYKKIFKQGEVVRFYLTNSSNTRVFNLSIPGVKMKLVGGDSGKYEREQWSSSVVLAPSERSIVEVLFEKEGQFDLKSISPLKTYVLGSFIVTNEKAEKSFVKEFSVLRENNDVIAEIDSFRKSFDKNFDKSISFTLDMLGMEGMGGDHMMSSGGMMNHGSMAAEEGMMMGGANIGDDEKIEWEDSMPMMNQMSNSDLVKWKIIDEVTGKEGMDVDWKFKVGDQVKMKIFNDPNSDHPMQHPFHIHGQRFLVLTTNGVKNTNLVWKDTVLIPKGDTVEILVDMQNPGLWMAHCHIAEHLESGMMIEFEVK
jgi:FtsP/CotA-like multicopper oxidase with cupredoxin domain